MSHVGLVTPATGTCATPPCTSRASGHATESPDSEAAALAAIEEALLEEARREARRLGMGADAAAVNAALAAKLERLAALSDADCARDWCGDEENDGDADGDATSEVRAETVAASEESLLELRRTELELAWQVLLETAQVHQLVRDVLDGRGKRSVTWRSEQLEYAKKYLELAKLKAETLTAEQLEVAYGDPECRATLEFLEQHLAEGLAEGRAKVAALSTRLERLQHLPENVVAEYARLQESISEREEYIRRLGEVPR